MFGVYTQTWVWTLSHWVYTLNLLMYILNFEYKHSIFSVYKHSKFECIHPIFRVNSQNWVLTLNFECKHSIFECFFRKGSLDRAQTRSDTDPIKQSSTWVCNFLRKARLTHIDRCFQYVLRSIIVQLYIGFQLFALCLIGTVSDRNCI